MTKFINPFTDVGFKKIFGQEMTKDLLIDFLNDLLVDEKHIIGHIDVNPIVRTKCPGNKFPIKNIIHDLQKIYNYKEKK